MEKLEIIEKLPHHVQQKLCRTRPPYRQGKKLTAVKVYTVNDESQHLIISGVPKLKLTEEIHKLICIYGDVKACCPIDGYPVEEFTEAFHVHFLHIQSARVAKRYIDGKNFFGGSLHVFYAPELETLSETRAKLAQRVKDIAVRIKRQEKELLCQNKNQSTFGERYHLRGQNTMEPFINSPDPSSSCYDTSQVTIELNERESTTAISTEFQKSQAPINHCLEKGKRYEKQKNYKGRTISSSVKVRIVRPAFANVADGPIIKSKVASSLKVAPVSIKTTASNTQIKAPQKNIATKRIVIKNPKVSRLIEPSELRSSIRLAKSQIRAAVQNVYSSANSLSKEENKTYGRIPK